MTFLLLGGFEFALPYAPAGARPQRVGSLGPWDVASPSPAPAGRGES